jgi:hypothetical protein
MVYDPTGLYPMGYDPHSMHTGAYGDPTNMYLSQPIQNATEVNSKFFVEMFFLYCSVN